MSRLKLTFSILLLCGALLYSGCSVRQEESVPAAPPEPPPISEPAPEPEPPPEPVYEPPVDFDEWQQTNEHIYSWITIPDTNVDYPVLQTSTDDEYYLRRDLDGNYDLGGSLFTQAMFNTMTYEDAHTIIYGHNMAGYGDTMFTDVRKYDDPDYFEAHRDVYVYTPQEQLHYRVFAAYVWSNEHLLYTYDTEDEQAFESYIDLVMNNADQNAIIDTEVELTAQDKILTLSTCEDASGVRRFLVQAVLIEDEAD